MKMRLILALLCAVAVVMMTVPLWAEEAIDEDTPTPSSVYETITPIEKSFIEKLPPLGLFPWIKEQLKEAPPFFRDTKLDLNLRTYYFDRRNPNDTVSEALASGGASLYRSGWFLDRFALGAVFYTSQPVYAPADRDGTGLLKPGQEGYTVLGQLYGRVKLFEDHFLTLYRSEYNTPYINKDDSLMTPNTFEGYTFQGTFGGKDGAPGLRYGGGYITKIKVRSSDEFISMSQAAFANVDRGVSVLGALFSYGRFAVGAFDYFSNDIINIGYTEARYTVPVTDRLGILFAAQFTDQRSVGDDLLTGDSFSTNQAGVKAAMSYGGGILTLGYTSNSRGAFLRDPWSSYPGYTSSQITKFQQAGENAFFTKVSYDFTRFGLQGVTAYALFAHGWGRLDPSTKEPAPDENEFNADFEWRPPGKFFEGFWLRVRYGIAHQYEGPHAYVHDLRVMAYYDFPLL